MSEVYFDLFVIICLGLFLRGIYKKYKLYDFPSLMSFIFLSFILPQAISLLRNPGIVSNSSVEKVLLMACLCVFMCWLGFTIKPSTALLNKFSYSANDKKLFVSGIFFSTVGLISILLLQRINIQTAVNSNWTGPATIIYFFGNLRHIGFAIILNLLLRRGGKINFTGLLFALIPVLYMIIVAGRRTSTFIFIITIGITIFYTKKILPSRLLIIAFVISTTFMIPLLGELRGEFWTLLFSGRFNEIDFSSGIDRILLSGDVLELRNAAMIIEAVDRSGSFGYGSGFWNDIVFQYVPGQIVGYDFKKSLQFNSTISEDIINFYGTSFSRGSTHTGIGDSYLEFGFAGCLIFALIAYFFKHIWLSSIYDSSIYSQFLYIGLISPILIGVTHGVGIFFSTPYFK
ncbi:MAG: hypothetical protein HC836_13770 [Richelia sp. RM2_1_2]|nr:hypothetical protein [Richelia sp. RM2_1_2]